MKAVAADADAQKFAETADFMCLICQELVWEPTICDTCSKLYCHSCISSWASLGADTSNNEHASCPGCRARQLPNLLQHNPKHVGIKRLLNKLRLKCPLAASGASGGSADGSVAMGVEGKKGGCGWSGDYWDASDHIQNRCDLTVLECSYCLSSMSRQDLSAHVSKCPKRPLACPECKEGPFAADVLKRHLDMDCAEQIIACSTIGCTWKGTRKSWKSHDDTSCQEKQMTCPVPTCGHKTKRQLLAQHLATSAEKHVELLLQENARLAHLLDSTKTGGGSSSSSSSSSSSDADAGGISDDSSSGGGGCVHKKDGKDGKDKKRKRTSTRKKDTTCDVKKQGGKKKAADTRDVKHDRVALPQNTLPCETQPKCPFNGFFQADNPFGSRCVECNRARQANKVPCESGISPQCWKRVAPHHFFGSTCKPCRDV